MAIKLGNTDINKIYLGSTEINKAYLGNDVIYDKSSAAFLYDTYPAFFGISAARQLKTGIIQVEELRRLSDNNEVDVDFDNGEKTLNSLVTGGSTLGTWSSATDAFSIQPYDQSGNNFVVEQTTAASQPHSVVNGALVTSGGKPAWDNNGKLGWSSSSNLVLSDTNELWIFAVVDISFTAIEENILVIGPTGELRARLSTSGVFTIVQKDDSRIFKSVSTINTYGSGRYILSFKFSVQNSECKIYVNGADDTGTALTATIPYSGFNSRLYLLRRQDLARIFLGTAQEIHIYKGDQSANRAAIEANINAYYNIW